MARLTYKNAGVDIDAGDLFVQKITSLVRSTYRPEVLADLGGFSGLFALRSKRFKEPVLVSGTDGVGTKLKIAFMTDRHDTVGIDLVAMCVNDVIVTGAEPLFFLDYFATGKLFPEKAVEVMKGIVEGCRQAGCALIGGETAEMPSFYPAGEYDLAGFAVGVAEKKKIIDGKKIRPGDLLIGLASSGLHSNGFSLVRKIVFEKRGLTVKDRFPGQSKSIGEILLTPTVIYAKVFSKLLVKVQIKGAAHITGGGITENLPRVLPPGCAAKVWRDRWEVPFIFRTLQEMGEVDTEEMYTDFNMGIGMILVIPPKALSQTRVLLKRLRQEAYLIGEIVKGEGTVIYA